MPAGNRKCLCRRIDGAAAIVVAASLAVLGLAAGAAQAAVPLPRPRPPLAAVPPSEQPPLPACRLALGAVAIAPGVPTVEGPGDCGGDDLVRLEAVVLAGGRRVALRPPATLRCEMAAAVAAWVREDVASLLAQGARLAAIEVADSFSCRGRNRVAGAKLSEHGRANAIDIRALEVEGAPPLALPGRDTPRDLRTGLRETMCARFTTVLGPGSDGFHDDHIHLDLRTRSTGYRICQWAIEDEASPPPGAGSAAIVPLPRPRPTAVRQARRQSR